MSTLYENKLHLQFADKSKFGYYGRMEVFDG